MKRYGFKYFLFFLIFLCLSNGLYAFTKAKLLELQCKSSEIVLPDGRILNDYIAVNDSDTLDNEFYISSALLETILGKQLYLDKEHQTLYIDTVPTAAVMSDKVKIYHYDYDSVHAFLYCPDAKTNKSMTMAGKTHHYGYLFSNVFSASFNLDQAYHEISGSLGLEDFKASDGQVDFYLDDQLIKSCMLKADSLPEKIHLDVENGQKLTLVFSHFKPDTQIDFADVYIH